MKTLPSILILTSLILAANKESVAQVKISAMPETKEDPAGGWIPVVLSNKNYKYNPGSYVQQKTIDNIRGLSPTNLPANYVYYVTDLGKQGFFQYDNADATSVDDGATVLVTKNNLRFKRIIENNTANAKWFEMGSDPAAVINTLKYRNNAVITYEQAKAIFDRPTNSRFTLSEADFTTQSATWFALQRAINFCLASGNKLYIPAGQYTVSKGLLVADLGNYISGFEIEGAATTYNGSSSQTVLNFTNKENFGIGFHRVKGLRVRNLFLKGQNVIGGSLYDWFENPDMDWTHGCRDRVWSPHAGFVVDPFFNQGQGGEEEMYPGFTSFYIDPDGSGGSTDVIFDNCRVEQFVVGYCFSPHAAPQNGDNIAVNNSWVNYCKSGISVGQSQNRSVAVNNLKCWGGVETLFDSQRYGDTYSADNVEVDQLQIAGGVKFLARTTGWANKGLQIRRMHAEVLLSLGTGGPIVIEDSFVDFSGSLQGQAHPARSAYMGSSLTVKDSFFGQYQGSNALPVVIHSPYAKFDNCTLYGGAVNCFTNGIYSGNIQEVKTKQDLIIPALYGKWTPEWWTDKYLVFGEGSVWNAEGDDGGRTFVGKRTGTNKNNDIEFALANEVTLTNIDNSAFTATFSLNPTSDDFKLLQVGENLYSRDAANEFGAPDLKFLIGVVESKNDVTGAVVLKQAAKGLNVTRGYKIFSKRRVTLILPYVMGTTIAGSNVITNVDFEARPESLAGITLRSPYFPVGTHIISNNIETKTMTMSNNALASGVGVEIISADWNAELHFTSPNYPWYNASTYGAYRKGDVIYNTDFANYPGVEKWVCTKGGIYGFNYTIYKPEFDTYYVGISTTLKADNGTVDISPGRLISSIIVNSTTALTAFKIGTTPNGNNVLPARAVPVGTSVIPINKAYFTKNIYGETKTTLYFSGIKGSVEIIIPK
jgi:hypothetical protein